MIEHRTPHRHTTPCSRWSGTTLTLYHQVSAYTANLAAFITASSNPRLSVTSMDDAVTNNKLLCYVDNGFEYPPHVKALYPRANYDTTSTVVADSAARLLAHDECQGLLTTLNEFKNLLMKPGHCNLEIVETLQPGQAGWATNQVRAVCSVDTRLCLLPPGASVDCLYNLNVCQDSPCVHLAINYAMKALEADGTLGKIVRSHFPAAPCDVGRRLHAGRQLKDQRGTTAAEESAGIPKMGVYDFLGVVIIWITCKLKQHKREEGCVQSDLRPRF